MMKRRLLRVMSIAAAAVPFAFASIRAAQTGQDFRYFWVALAGLLGAVGTVVVVRARESWSTPAALAAAAFVVSTLLAAAAAVLIGTKPGLGLLVVAASFALCFAAGAFLDALARV